jgi:hypothetical protein
VYAQDALAALEVGEVDDDAAVEAAGAEEAGSRTSGRFVAATRITPSFDARSRGWHAVMPPN